MNKRIVITGANGYIGNHIVKYLLDNYSYDLLCVDFRNDKIDKRAHYRNIDVLGNADSKDLFDQLGNPDIVIHCAWQDGFNHMAESHIENLNKHYMFLKNMVDSGVKSITVMGSMHEIGYIEGSICEDTPCNPLSNYGVAKNALRQLISLYIQDKSTKLKWLRAFYIYGDDRENKSIFAKLIEAEENNQVEFPFTTGTNQYDFIEINELAKQISKASVQDEINGIINVCSGKPISLKDKVEAFIKENNFDIKLRYGVFPARKYDSPIVYGDNTKIKKIVEL